MGYRDEFNALSSGEVVVGPSMHNQIVLNAQTCLSILDYNTSACDGWYGPITANAIYKYKTRPPLNDRSRTLSRQDYIALTEHAHQKLKQDLNGFPNDNTPIVGQSSGNGDLTRNVQLMCQCLGCDAGPIDGNYGRRTKSGIKAYQKKYGLPETGTLTRKQYLHLVEHFKQITEPENAISMTATQSTRATSTERKQTTRARQMTSTEITARHSTNNQRTVVFLGDSIAEGLYLSAKRRGIPAVDMGEPSKGLEFLKDKHPINESFPKNALIIISLGTNDLGGLSYDRPEFGKKLQEYIERLKDYLTEIKDKGRQIVLLGVSSNDYNWPYRNKQAWNNQLNGAMNDALRNLAQEMDITFSDRGQSIKHGKDGLHYTNDGYQDIVSKAITDAGLTLPQLKGPSPLTQRHSSP